MKYFDHDDVHPVTPPNFIIGEVDGYNEENNGNKYVFASTDKNKGILAKYTELWDKIKSQIEKISDKPGEYGKDLL